MRINIKGTGMEITSAIGDYLNKKLEHINKFVDPADESALCDVELGKTTKHHNKGDLFRAEINLHIKGKNLRAVSETEDLYASIDEVKDEMTRELLSSKDRKVSLIKRGGAKIKNVLKGIFTNE